MIDPVTKLTAKEQAVANRLLDVLRDFDPDARDRILAKVQEQLDAEDAPVFARGIAGPLGKLDYPLKTKVDEHTHTLFLQQCALQRTDASNQIRNCVYALVHGKSYDQMVVERLSHDAKRTDALAKLIGPFGAPECGEHP
jgi:hypothetical protein